LSALRSDEVPHNETQDERHAGQTDDAEAPPLRGGPSRPNLDHIRDMLTRRWTTSDSVDLKLGRPIIIDTRHGYKHRTHGSA